MARVTSPGPESADTDNVSWADLGVVCPKTVNVTIPEKFDSYKALKMEKPGLIVSAKVNRYVTPVSSPVRSVVGETASEHSGEYNTAQIYALYDWVRANIAYVNDPRGKDYWMMPDETLDSGVGDCEDQAFLLSSLVESIGGTTKLYYSDDHMFAAFYSGDNESTEKIKQDIRKTYDVPYVVSLPDEYGNWITLDTTCGYYPGDLPCNTGIVNSKVVLLNNSKLTEVYVDV
jgi:hypothetical protein